MKYLALTVTLGLALGVLPIYAQTVPEEASDEQVTTATSDRAASVTCKRAQAKLSDYLDSLDDFRDEQLSGNRSTLAFVNNISLRLEHNSQTEENLLSEDVKFLNDSITDQEIAYTELQSQLRSAISSSCITEEQVDVLRDDVDAIRQKISEINQLQVDFETYTVDMVIPNLEQTYEQLDLESEAEGVNT